MKRCPECGRDYDNTMMFCLDDGAELLYGPASGSGSVPAASAGGQFGDEPQTAILHTTDSVGESPTREQITTADQTAVFRRGAEAESRESLGDLSRKRSFSARRNAKPLIPALLVVLVIVGGFFGYRYFSASGSNQINSIAVLPFENRSGNADADYLADGLTDSLIFRFSQLPNLKVSPTSSVMRFKGKAEDVAQIAKQLDVDGVLTGRLSQIGDDLNISVQLVDARTGKLVWAENYDRKMADLLATQREIATTLTQKMQLKLAADETGIAKKYTSNNEAYNLYLKGRYHWSRRARDDMFKAIENYKKSIELDPQFALAYSGIAEVYNSMAKHPHMPPKDCVPLAKTAATRALEIDPQLAQAHSALADSLAIYDWNWAEAEKHFKRAIELDPKVSYTHLAYASSFLMVLGRHDESIEHARRSIDLEPSSLIANAVAVHSYMNARRYNEGIAVGRAAVELDPNFSLAPNYLGLVLVANGNTNEAIELTKGSTSEGPSGWLKAVALAHAYAKAGNGPETERVVAWLRDVDKTEYIPPYYYASIFATLGDKEKAFVELNRAFEARDFQLGQAGTDPFMDPLRDDTRFKEILTNMGLAKLIK